MMKSNPKRRQPAITVVLEGQALPQNRRGRGQGAGYWARRQVARQNGARGAAGKVVDRER